MAVKRRGKKKDSRIKRAGVTGFNKPKIDKISTNQFRVFLGPFDNINSLQNAFNVINILMFENIEIIKK